MASSVDSATELRTSDSVDVLELLEPIAGKESSELKTLIGIASSSDGPVSLISEGPLANLDGGVTMLACFLILVTSFPMC